MRIDWHIDWHIDDAQVLITFSLLKRKMQKLCNHGIPGYIGPPLGIYPLGLWARASLWNQQPGNRYTIMIFKDTISLRLEKSPRPPILFRVFPEIHLIRHAQIIWRVHQAMCKMLISRIFRKLKTFQSLLSFLWWHLLLIHLPHLEPTSPANQDKWPRLGHQCRRRDDVFPDKRLCTI